MVQRLAIVIAVVVVGCWRGEPARVEAPAPAAARPAPAPRPVSQAGRALEKMGEFRDEICACPDKACTDRVIEAMTRWGAQQSGDHGEKFTEDDARRMMTISEEMTSCMTRLMSAPSGAPPTP